MLSINTNMPSLIAQRSLNNSTKLLNQAIERMTTGFKINHASDNAANYSITTNMNTKLSSYQVAEDNVAMGLDLLSTAGGSLDLISDKLTRLRALAEQSANGTYGEQSLKAINGEAVSIIDEINRIYSTAEYNGVKLFGHSGRFLEDIERRDTTKMTTLNSVDESQSLTSGTYSISTADELAKLARMANVGNIQGAEFVLANDIDLSEYSTGTGWTSIGIENWTSNHFNGIFDGNGYIISNLYINRPAYNRLGLFGVALGEIKNLGLENVDVTGNMGCGALIGMSPQVGDAKLLIENCYVKNGSVKAEAESGGLIGQVRAKSNIVKSCYSDVTLELSGQGMLGGGLLGDIHQADTVNLIENCYALGDVLGVSALGGLVGFIAEKSATTISNCYAEGNISATGEILGGLIGNNNDSKTNVVASYATGDILTTDTRYGNVGGLIGVTIGGNFKHCYATGKLTAPLRAAGLIGLVETGTTEIDDCYSSCVIDCAKQSGGLVGYAFDAVDINNSYVLGKSENLSGIFVGFGGSAVTINNCYYNSYYEGSGKKLVASLPNDSDKIQNVKSYSGKVPFKLNSIDINLQVGINSNDSSSLEFTTSFLFREINDLYNLGLGNNDYISKIDNLINTVSAKQTDFGSVQNRLESALEEISTQYDNLVSSRSTLRDADIAEVSSEYIRQQILQQASATLMATANQSPSLALQLI